VDSPQDGKSRVQSTWPIMRIAHERSRYLWEAMKEQTISKELYEYCVKEKLVDVALVAKWKKQGYETLCCLRCIQPRDTNFGSVCICRVPRKKMSDTVLVECQHCGCHGCSH
jgi:bud site selection protein 31